MKKTLFLALASSFLLAATSCSKPDLRPQLFPNGKLRSVGQAKAEMEIDECMELAKNGKDGNSDTYFVQTNNNVSGRNPEFEHKVNKCLRARDYNPINWK